MDPPAELTTHHLDHGTREILETLPGRLVRKVHADRSQVVLVLDDGVVDMQPQSERPAPTAPGAEFCFASARVVRGDGVDLPRRPPIATDVVLGQVLVATTVVYLVEPRRGMVDRALERLTGRGKALPGLREQLCRPGETRWRRHRCRAAVEIDAGFVLCFDAGVLGAFAVDNAWRFAIEPEAPFVEPADLHRTFGDRYVFREAAELSARGEAAPA